MVLLAVVSGSSIVDNAFGVLSFFLSFIDVLRSDKTCTFRSPRVVSVSSLFTKSSKSSSNLLAGLPTLL